MDYVNYLEEACGYNDTLSDIGSISISQSSNGKNKDYTDVKKTDPGYNKFYAHTKKIINGKTVKKQFQIKLYTTSLVPGSMIRSALGGGYNTNYTILRSANDNRITVAAPATELGITPISVTR